MRKTFCLLFIFSVFFAENLRAKINIGILKGMDSIPFAFLYSDVQENQKKLENPEVSEVSELSDVSEEVKDSSEEQSVQPEEKYSFSFFETPLELFSKMKAGYIDASIISSESAEKLVKKSNGQVCVCASVTSIDFKIVTRRKGNISFSDLIGNKVYVAGEGLAHSVFLALLAKNSVPVEEGSAGVEIVVKKSQAELVTEFLSKNADYVLVSEPALSDIFNRSKNARVAIDIQEQYETVFGYGKKLPRSVLVVRRDLAEGSPREFKNFLADVEFSVQRASRKPRGAAGIAAKNDFGVNKRISAQAIAGTKFNFYTMPLD